MDTADLIRLHACQESVLWAARQLDALTAWYACDRGDRIAWLLVRTSARGDIRRHQAIVLVAIHLASLWHLMAIDQRIRLHAIFGSIVTPEDVRWPDVYTTFSGLARANLWLAITYLERAKERDGAFMAASDIYQAAREIADVVQRDAEERALELLSGDPSAGSQAREAGLFARQRSLDDLAQLLRSWWSEPPDLKATP
jgi:hypothetical protein